MLKNSVSWSTVNIYAWDTNGTIITAVWPGTTMSTTTVDGYEYYYYTFKNVSSVNVIFNDSSTEQTVNLENVTKDTYFELGGKGGDGNYSATSSDVPTGIEEVGVDAGAAVYYNLQGVKVANPENGIFIKKQGSKATKVIL